jgi:dTDP-N-acetylfucosamine:lipid II N-acetylfucosaminyltransferase
MHTEKFIDPFIDFVERHFDSREHLYLVREVAEYAVRERPNVRIYRRKAPKLSALLDYILALNRAEKIFLHSVVYRTLMWLLFLQPWLFRKCHLLLWGNELYYHLRRPPGLRGWLHQRLLARIIRKSAVLVTFLEGDIERAREWFGAQGRLGECMLYPSNLCKPVLRKARLPGAPLTLMIGNSATATNQHEQVFEALAPHWKPGMRIYCPLSYGDASYAEHIARLGQERFGANFIALRTFLSLDEYNRILNEVDVVLFGHNRAQAMGNLISLVSMAKKIYLTPGTSQWALFERLGIQVYDIGQLQSLAHLDSDTLERNAAIALERFSELRLAEQYRSLFA